MHILTHPIHVGNRVAALLGRAVALNVFSQGSDHGLDVLTQQPLSGRSCVTGVDEHGHAWGIVVFTFTAVTHSLAICQHMKRSAAYQKQRALANAANAQNIANTFKITQIT